MTETARYAPSPHAALGDHSNRLHLSQLVSEVAIAAAAAPSSGGGVASPGASCTLVRRPVVAIVARRAFRRGAHRAVLVPRRRQGRLGVVAPRVRGAFWLPGAPPTAEEARRPPTIAYNWSTLSRAPSPRKVASRARRRRTLGSEVNAPRRRLKLSLKTYNGLNASALVLGRNPWSSARAESNCHQ